MEASFNTCLQRYIYTIQDKFESRVSKLEQQTMDVYIKHPMNTVYMKYCEYSFTTLYFILKLF